MTDNASYETERNFRPLTLAMLLDTIQLVLQLPSSDHAMDILRPSHQLDMAVQALMYSPVTISWCWSTWDERRTAFTETIDCLVSILFSCRKHTLTGISDIYLVVSHRCMPPCSRGS